MTKANVSPGAAATATGTNNKAGELPTEDSTKRLSQATFFWDARSNSVEPLAMRQAVPA